MKNVSLKLWMEPILTIAQLVAFNSVAKNLQKFEKSNTLPSGRINVNIRQTCQNICHFGFVVSK